MKKIITLSVLLVLSSCSTSQIKTSEAATQIPLSYENVSIPQESQSLASKINSNSRYHSVLEFGKQFLSDQSDADSAKKDDSTQLASNSFLPRIARYIKKGMASWYGPGFHGKKTATGEIFNMYELTAAHKTLPIPSYAQVTNLKNNKTVVVRINDRGPYSNHRIVDLSYAAAKRIGLQGTGQVEIKAISSLQALPHIQKTAENKNQKVYLQVGSFESQNKALKLQDKIASNNLPESAIYTSKKRKNTLYKVQMGPIKSTEHAEMLSYQLAKIGITDPQIVTETRQN